MNKNNIPLIVLLILLLISGFISFKFYSDAQMLSMQNKELKEENAKLLKENTSLRAEKKDLSKQLKNLQRRLNMVQADLDKAEEKYNDLKERYEQILAERNILEKRVQELARRSSKPESERKIVPEEEVSAGYWEDVVRERAELRAEVEELNKELLDLNHRLSELDKQNKELSLKIDELTNDKEKLEKELAFKERTLQLLSRDLVNERERRKEVEQQIATLREENMELKQDMIALNTEKARLQEKIQELVKKRSDLEKKVSQVERILKEKSLLFEQLKDELTKALKEEKGSVELPPIVVESEKSEQQEKKEVDISPVSSSVASEKKLEGSLLAVNEKEKFVVIDLGDEAGVRPGMQFTVFRGDKPIGTIEVIETRKDISAADIKEVTRGYSFKEGDKIISK